MAEDIAQFFNAGDGFTVFGEISTLGIEANGYFDAEITDFNLDDSGPSVERYTFVCAVFPEWRSVVGQNMVINEQNYRITKSTPDGTGLLTLNLFCED